MTQEPGKRERPTAAAANADVHFVFGPFELVSDRGSLERIGQPVPIAPKPYAVLLYLIRERPRTIPRGELLEAIWPGVTVGDSAFASVIRDLRRMLGDAGQRSRYVETVRGQGLRFIHPVDERVPSSAEPSTWDVAADRLERALPALDAIHDLRGNPRAVRGRSSSDRNELLLALGRARWAAGSTDASRGVFLRAADAARVASDPEVFGWAALGFSGRTDLAPEVGTEAVALLEEALQWLPDEATALRAELLARLGTELYFSSDADRSDKLTREAVALAESLEDRSALAYVLTARQFVLYRPDVPPEERVPLAERAIELLDDGPASDVLALGLQERMVDRLELGQGQAFREGLSEFSDVADALGQPFFLWTRCVFDGIAAYLDGDLTVAERLAFEALDLGQVAGTPNAFPTHLAQLYAIRHEQGRLSELADPIQALLEDRPDGPLFLAALASARAAGGQIDEARRALERLLALGVENIPHDLHWLATLAIATQATAVLGEIDPARVLAGALDPYRGRLVMIGYGAATLGAVDHHLGVLAQVRGLQREARDHYRLAHALHQSVGATLWSDRTHLALEALA